MVQGGQIYDSNRTVGLFNTCPLDSAFTVLLKAGPGLLQKLTKKGAEATLKKVLSLSHKFYYDEAKYEWVTLLENDKRIRPFATGPQYSLFGDQYDLVFSYVCSWVIDYDMLCDAKRCPKRQRTHPASLFNLR